MYLSNYAEQKFLNVMRNMAFTAPSQIYVALFLTNPKESGTEGTEINYSGYARQLITFDPPEPISGGIGIKNTSQITFPPLPSSISSETIRYTGIFDAAIGGNLILYGELLEELTIEAEENPVFLPAEIIYYSLGNLSNVYKTKLFNICRGQTIEPIAKCHIGLWNGDPEDGGQELVGANYERVEITFSGPTEDLSGLSIINNTELRRFNRASGLWGNWTHTVIHPDKTGATAMWKKQRQKAKLVSKGIMPYFDIGTITVGIN